MPDGRNEERHQHAETILAPVERGPVEQAHERRDEAIGLVTPVDRAERHPGGGARARREEQKETPRVRPAGILAPGGVSHRGPRGRIRASA